MHMSMEIIPNPMIAVPICGTIQWIPFSVAQPYIIRPVGMQRQAGPVIILGSRSSGLTVWPEACLALIILSETVDTNNSPANMPTPDPRNASPTMEVLKWYTSSKTNVKVVKRM